MSVMGYWYPGWVDKDTQRKIELFFSQFRLIRYQSGEMLFSAQDRPSGIFYLKRGFVRQYAISEQGAELTIHLYGPGSYFPMMWGLNVTPNRHHFQAMTGVEVFLGPKDKVAEFLGSDSTVALALSKRLLAGLDGLTRRIECMSFGKAYDRVVSVLLYLADHFGVKKGRCLILNHRFTHGDIASMVGITREHVSLEMEKLEKTGLIKYQGHSIQVPDIAKLALSGEFSPESFSS